jgi:2-polyprenyl-3-methyl-5-hydroxy-6-metoxy-1,4-benzoquinol methylase
VTGTGGKETNFDERRQAARERMQEIEARTGKDAGGRGAFFNAVYEQAEGDAAAVPWVDLAPKAHLVQWLEANNGFGLSALDIACGLGDNAEALAAAGYRTTAFDLADDAIAWARQRFPDSEVEYTTADLFDPPAEWGGAFDLVNECYTLQALPPGMLEQTAAAIAGLVAPDGRLLVYTRTRPNGTFVDGPPWPLEEGSLRVFERYGFAKESETRFTIDRSDRVIPHSFAVWRKS